MRLKIIVLLALLCAGALLWDRWEHNGGDVAPTAAVGTLPTPAQAEALVPLINATKPVTIVHFWATWCPPCMVEMPQILKALQKVPDGVAVTMVNLDDPAPAAFYAKEKLVTAPRAEAQVSWLDDPQQARAKAVFEKVMLPVTLVVDGGSGRILQQIDGPLMWAPLMAALSGNGGF